MSSENWTQWENITLNQIRSSGYWVMQGSWAVGKMILRCVTCRRLRGRVGQQIVADLPHDILKEESLFTNCEVDIFGSFLIKERSNTLKWYGALFTCLASHAIHIEMIKNMDTDSFFMMALRRFIGRRGNIWTIWCNNGSNFLRAERELAKCWKEVDQKKLGEFMLQNSADWIQWKKNQSSISKPHVWCMGKADLICQKHTLISHKDTLSKFGWGIT